MKITLNKTITQDFEAAKQREWLETNGLGGWAGASLSGANTRRYHGLLIAATHPPVGRMALLSKLDETIQIDGQRFELGCNQYPGAVHPRGFQYMRSFEKGFFPAFEYSAGGVEIRKTIAAINGENTVLVLFEVLRAPGAFTMEFLPLIAFRDYHSLMHANDAIRRDGDFREGTLRVMPYQGVPELFISVPGASFEARPGWYYNFEYPVEQYRGLDFREDLFSHGIFKIDLVSGSKIGIIISTEDPAGRDAFKLFNREKKRRQDLFRRLPIKDEFAKTLTLAADQFIVKRDDDLRTIIAGYHWFTDWGRDTMISLPGLTLATGRFEEAKQILRAFAAHVDRGMLPNRFADGAGDLTEYNTVDATLWYFVAIYKYWQYTHDDELLRSELMPVLQEIIDWHERGTRYNIRVDSDGLLYAGEPGVQLTWMDAKIGDWVVTPRQGKAVEINALWYNVLKMYAFFQNRFGNETASVITEKRACQVKKRFNELFWNEAQQCLYDYVDGDHRNNDIRPNQIFALSLPFSILPEERELAVLKIVEEKLLTPAGLRSLSAEHSAYRPVYGGDAYSRDSGYHQGTVWGWLIGPYITALVRIKGGEGKWQAKKIFKDISALFNDAGIGTISEIFDAEAPHTPRGCMAQAWSVAEVLRAYVEDIKEIGKGNGQFEKRHLTMVAHLW